MEDIPWMEMFHSKDVKVRVKALTECPDGHPVWEELEKRGLGHLLAFAHSRRNLPLVKQMQIERKNAARKAAQINYATHWVWDLNCES